MNLTAYKSCLVFCGAKEITLCLLINSLILGEVAVLCYFLHCGFSDLEEREDGQKTTMSSSNIRDLRCLWVYRSRDLALASGR